MTEGKKPHDIPPLLCVGCGTPMKNTSNGFCRQCQERGLGPCEACEGISLLDVEENAS